MKFSLWSNHILYVNICVRTDKGYEKLVNVYVEICCQVFEAFVVSGDTKSRELKKTRKHERKKKTCLREARASKLCARLHRRVRPYVQNRISRAHASYGKCACNYEPRIFRIYSLWCYSSEPIDSIVFYRNDKKLIECICLAFFFSLVSRAVRDDEFVISHSRFQCPFK